MNRKGFAVTGIIYTLMIVFIILIIALLSMFSDRKNLLDELKERVLDDVNNYEEALNITYSAKSASELEQGEFYKYVVKVKGYYNLSIRSVGGKNVNANIYLKEGEKIYLKVGSSTFNNGKTDIYLNGTDTSNLVMTIQKNGKYTIKNPDVRLFLDVNYEATEEADASATVLYNNNKRKNSDLNRVRYIKECLYSNSANDINEWSEIMAIRNGENRALSTSIKDISVVDAAKLILDGNINTRTNSLIEPENDTCITVDLGRTFDLDAIYVWHNYSDNRIYYERRLYVSTDDIDYVEIDNNEEVETEQGIKVSAFDTPKVVKVGNVVLPVKRDPNDNTTWVRIFHHNNRGGTVLWDAKSQVLLQGGYSNFYKSSGLYYITNYRNGSGYYELRLEYPELGTDKYIKWQQKSDFTRSTSVSSYQSYHNDYDNVFTGLRLNQTVDAVITGDANKYQIGALKATENGIVGPNGIITGIVDLWIKK